MHQHAFNAVLECDRARVAGSTGATQLEQDMTVLETPEFDVPTVILNGWTYPSVKKLLDHPNHFAIVLVEFERILLPSFLTGLACLVLDGIDHCLTRCDSLGDQAKNLGLHMCPVRIFCLGDCDKVRPIKYRRNAVNVE